MPTNPLRWWVRFCWGMAFAGLFAIAAPFIFEIDMMDGGGAMLMVGGLVAVTGCISALMISGQAALCDDLFSKKDLLAHWTYEPEEWARYAERELADEGSAKAGLLALVAVISLVIGGVFAIADPENGPFVLAVLFAVVVLCAIVAYWTTKSRHARHTSAVGEAYVGRTAVYLAGEFHSWAATGCSLLSVAIEDGEPSLLVVDYEQPQRYGTQPIAVRVPIPQGEEKAAAQLVETLCPGK